LNALLLLALRCIVVALVTLLLAGLYIPGDRKQERWILVEQGLEREEPWTQLIDSLEAQGYAAKRLASGFPEIESTESLPVTPPDYWTLVDALSGVQLDRCVIISRNRMKGFTGARPELPGYVTWLTAAADSTEYLLASRKNGNDPLLLRVGRSNGQRTSYVTLRTSGTPASATDPSGKSNPGVNAPLATAPKEIRVAIAANGNDEEKRIVTASLQAISENVLAPIQVTAAPKDNLPKDADWLIWLSEDAAPQTNIPNIIRKRSTSSAHADQENTVTSLLEAQACEDKASCWTITRSLTTTTALEGQLTLRLARLLLGDVTARLDADAAAYDRRVLPDRATFSSAASGNVATFTGKNAQRDASGVIALVLMAMLVVERFIANRQQL
jgi:hypothetical protein